MTFLPNLRRLPLKAALAAALALGGVSAASAQQEISPEHLSFARQYVDMTDQANIFENRLVALGVTIMRTLVQQDPSLTEPVQETVREAVQEYLEQKDPLYDQFARIYASRFTIEELQEIIAFYETETGQKLLDQNRGINRDLQGVMEVWQRNASQELMARTRAMLREDGYEI
ncbi:DUF2059 domain-containing protein [Pelagibacterium xiamenense]|uniref:DUF2059 domain-containing protein n=1 Tax=Pelagibacterium xiamenense TaxID=2901140 RepID=UPI001E3B63F6|nr:DUF2059 domain-containing protein [Pelagibacterium xiamenense]MCD7059601.1 DUF2059 domain-containing protein [Pelagibacterium xiamenense]